MRLRKKIQITFLLSLLSLVVFYSYYYLPSQNPGFVKVNPIKNLPSASTMDAKNTFTNVEYKSQDSKGQLYTTRSEESFFYQKEPDLIHLINPYSFTQLKKDGSLIEVTSKVGLFDKIKKITTYENNVSIKNKNYIITSKSAKHFAEKNIIIISGNVILKDLTMGLSHIAYSDAIEINTLTNDVMAFMTSSNARVIAKKFK